MAGYLPLGDAELRTWARNFGQHIASNPQAYDLGPAEVAAITQAVDAYLAAAALTAQRQTRTQVQVATKNAARKTLLRVVRGYAQLIKANPAVADSRKVDLGIRPETGQRTPIARPSSYPVLHVMPSTPFCHELRYKDAANPDAGGGRGRGGKPPHVIGLQLFCHVGSEAPADPLDARFVRFVTRQSHTVQFKGEQAGKKAFYYARWQTATGETGPWSQVASMTVAG